MPPPKWPFQFLSQNPLSTWHILSPRRRLVHQNRRHPCWTLMMKRYWGVSGHHYDGNGGAIQATVIERVNMDVDDIGSRVIKLKLSMIFAFICLSTTPTAIFFFFNHTLLLPIELLSTLTLVYSALFNSWIAPVLNVLLLSTLTLVYATIYAFIPDCFYTSSEKCAYVTLITNCSRLYPCAWKMCVAGTGTWIIFELEQIGTRLTSTSPGSPSLHPITTQSLHFLNY